MNNISYPHFADNPDSIKSTSPANIPTVTDEDDGYF